MLHNLARLMITILIENRLDLYNKYNILQFNSKYIAKPAPYLKNNACLPSSC